MFRGRTFALLTQHGKEAIIAPLLDERLQATLRHTRAFDTDQLGTFTGEIEREMSPVDCACKKARLACELTENTLGLGSEGSFFPSPYGIGTVSEEFLACVDVEQNWTVLGRFMSPIDVRQAECNDIDDIMSFVNQVPDKQGMILKTNRGIAKGLHGEQAVRETLETWFADSGFETTTIAYDLRAHQCPVRQENISRAAENLVERLLSICPECSVPGFWPDQSVKGLPCELCMAPTSVNKEYVAECDSCSYQQVFPVEQPTAEARLCDFCNP